MGSILITGCAGFIGSNLSESLLKDYNKIVGVDNLSTGRECNIPRHKNFKFYKIDLTNKEALDVIMKDNKIDVVLNLAGNASIVNAMKNPASDVANNILSTMNVVDLCIEHKVDRLLHASTMVVYGESNVNKKEGDVCEPISTYGLTKYAGERYVINAGNRTDMGFKLNVTAFRMFNVYGPKQDLDNPYQGVVAIFMGRVKSKKDIEIHGDGEQTRDFVYIDDVVDAWKKSINSKKTYGQVLNLGSGVEISIKRIAEMVIEKTDGDLTFSPEIRYSTSRQGDIKRCLCNPKKLMSLLNWKPRTKFDIGLEKFIQSCRVAEK